MDAAKMLFSQVRYFLKRAAFSFVYFPVKTVADTCSTGIGEAGGTRLSGAEGVRSDTAEVANDL
jgi:hypothetical protein